jgi:hypothetical protein
MPTRKTNPEQSPRETYLQDGNIEAHIIADMLRIESITAELREFKDDTKKRLDKLEGWIVAIVGVTVTTLIATLGGLVFRVLGGS